MLGMVIADGGGGILVTDELHPGRRKEWGPIDANNPGRPLEKAFEIGGKRASVVVLKYAAEMLPMIRYSAQ